MVFWFFFSLFRLILNKGLGLHISNIMLIRACGFPYIGFKELIEQRWRLIKC